MPIPRSQQVSLESTPYYHCVSRCVRRAFLCGEDPVTGSSYEHRRGWIEKRLLFLASVFSIDICAYAIMSNHLHVVLHVDLESSQKWSTQDVLEKWHRLHKGTPYTQQYVKGEALSPFALKLVEASAESFRNRLVDISWFMKELNEPIARHANTEDKCTGHFWEGRFKSQALLDEAALIACMAYVDLNPVRAKMNDTPETSDFTSIKQRIGFLDKNIQPKFLSPFIGNTKQNMPNGLPFQLKDYLELVDMTGRMINSDKKGAIDVSLLPILQRLSISADNWFFIATQFGKKTDSVVGRVHSINHYCESKNRKRQFKRQSALLFA